MQLYETLFLAEADRFIQTLDSKTRKKVFYNIRLAENANDPELFKKLNNDIWEFRTHYLGIQIRLLAFWDKSDNKQTLVLATNGFFKKTQKTPKSEIERAERIRINYFDEKIKKQPDGNNEKIYPGRDGR